MGMILMSSQQAQSESVALVMSLIYKSVHARSRVCIVNEKIVIK